MKRGAISKLGGMEPRQFDLYQQRQQLPFEVEEGGKDYSLTEAVMLRCFRDLVVSGLRTADASVFILNGIERIERGAYERYDGMTVCMREPRQLFSAWDDEIWIAREVWAAGYSGDSADDRDFSVTWWGGTKEEVFSEIAFRNAEEAAQNRETVSVQLYSLSKARAKVLAAARENGLADLPESEEAL